ncbi:MAG: glycoside hydrolase family 97 catalytic domain-containing protein [Phycisphaerae bacterium]|nr:glycoside hydrolase family 97 protein [Phycisphaerae bacterium]HOJ55711.1 glycoside hydrolase family 97 catalytic domain-containing protein [Phycisphaerae bacterium]HOL26126.1 glycoside hydrolase family 97 catalytic domain-containing protein [Phycisphaerae bacterium]HPP22042.1 glycoside hydrolase family 97 catalytic domain-containing protein [Phycisphaerae bacterium]
METERFITGPMCFYGMLILSCLTASSALAAWDVTSPNGQVRLSVRLTRPPGFGEGGERLSYQVEHGPADARRVIIADSPMGLLLEHQDFVNALRFDSVEGPRRIEERYSMPHGKRRECRNVGQALLLRFRNAGDAVMELELRAYDDGAAFRYRLLTESKGPQTFTAENTGFNLPADAKMWLHPYDKITTYSPAYETYFENGIPAGSPAPTEMGWAFPVLFRTADEKHWALITEADVGPNCYGARLAQQPEKTTYRIRLPDPAEGNGYGAPAPALTLPWQSAWRVIILGDSPGDIVESTLVQDVSEASRVKDVNWIHPGRVAWSWWSDQASPKDAAKQKRFIDFAAEMGWEYVLVDANWTIIDNGSIHDVIRYAKDKGIGVLLWYNSGGPHNVVTEKPRDCFFFPQVRRHELQLLKDWGVKGVKVDFFQSDKPEIIALYHAILKDAADFGIMVNFHGCTLPRGWSRTYPHLMSMEAIRGEECYLFDSHFPDRAPVQNTITPFTRNAVGPMDYTPMGLGKSNHPRKTTDAHELALTVLFESGWVHFADDPDVYRNLPAEPKQFVREVPVAWDDTRFVTGYPGRDVCLARRKGETWYLAGVNGQNTPCEQKLDLGKFLPAGRYQMTLIADGQGSREFSTQTRTINAADPVQVNLLPRGGFVARLTPAK